ncbi:hypothetical protein T484DRAFT_1803020 [Baffinella frigidus]|nr:hypothetical protein T484DRAFT_1803020 [Cryptophyta sp. CCMP2293]
MAPCVVFVAWLDLVTYLHHTDKDMPWYRDPEWSYLRGGLTTTDRDYGILNGVHHDIGTHVVHHLFPQIPHYNLCEATEAVKPLMGPYYREPQASGFLPLHLIPKMIEASGFLPLHLIPKMMQASGFLPLHFIPKMIEGVKTCAYVKDEGSVVYYQDAAGKVSSIEQGAKKLYTPQEFA